VGLITELERATQLWICGNYREENLDLLAKQLRICNFARDMLLKGLISYDDFLDILNENKIDIDGYESILEDNLERIYG
jgi:hypothetical protein